MSQPAPGWYPDQANPHLVRWWDGYRWTSHTQPVPPQQPPSGPQQGAAQYGAPHGGQQYPPQYGGVSQYGGLRQPGDTSQPGGAAQHGGAGQYGGAGQAGAPPVAAQQPPATPQPALHPAPQQSPPQQPPQQSQQPLQPPAHAASQFGPQPGQSGLVAQTPTQQAPAGQAMAQLGAGPIYGAPAITIVQDKRLFVGMLARASYAITDQNGSAIGVIAQVQPDEAKQDRTFSDDGGGLGLSQHFELLDAAGTPYFHVARALRFRSAAKPRFDVTLPNGTPIGHVESEKLVGRITLGLYS